MTAVGLQNDRVTSEQVYSLKYKNRKIGGDIQKWTSPPMSLFLKSFPQDRLKYQETLDLGIQH